MIILKHFLKIYNSLITGPIYCNHSHGNPHEILTISVNGEINADFDQFKSIFGHQSVENRQIVVLSITGTPKKGKSFVLNYFLRYLYAHVSN